VVGARSFAMAQESQVKPDRRCNSGEKEKRKHTVATGLSQIHGQSDLQDNRPKTSGKGLAENNPPNGGEIAYHDRQETGGDSP